MLKDIAEQVVKLGGENVLVLSALHMETNNSHLHFVISGTRLDGFANRINKNEYVDIPN